MPHTAYIAKTPPSLSNCPSLRPIPSCPVTIRLCTHGTFGPEAPRHPYHTYGSGLLTTGDGLARGGPSEAQRLGTATADGRMHVTYHTCLLYPNGPTYPSGSAQPRIFFLTSLQTMCASGRAYVRVRLGGTYGTADAGQAQRSSIGVLRKLQDSCMVKVRQRQGWKRRRRVSGSEGAVDVDRSKCGVSYAGLRCLDAWKHMHGTWEFVFAVVLCALRDTQCTYCMHLVYARVTFLPRQSTQHNSRLYAAFPTNIHALT